MLESSEGRRGSEKENAMLTLGLLVLGLVTFAALLAFVELCDRV